MSIPPSSSDNRSVHSTHDRKVQSVNLSRMCRVQYASWCVVRDNRKRQHGQASCHAVSEGWQACPFSSQYSCHLFASLLPAARGLAITHLFPNQAFHRRGNRARTVASDCWQRQNTVLATEIHTDLCELNLYTDVRGPFKGHGLIDWRTSCTSRGIYMIIKRGGCERTHATDAK